MANLMNLRIYKVAFWNPNLFQQVVIDSFSFSKTKVNKERKKLKSSERRCNPRVLNEAKYKDTKNILRKYGPQNLFLE